MFATPAEAPLRMKWKDAIKYAKELGAHGHQDWRLPTLGELNVLFNNHAAIGGFNVSSSGPAGWYWSGMQLPKRCAWFQRSSDGRQGADSKGYNASVRCVR